MEYLHDRLDIDLPAGDLARCAYTQRNAQCAREQCPFFDASDDE